MSFHSWDMKPQIQWLLSIFCYDSVDHLKQLNHDVFFLVLPKLDSNDTQRVIWRNIFKVGCLDQGIEMITNYVWVFFLKAVQYTP